MTPKEIFYAFDLQTSQLKKNRRCMMKSRPRLFLLTLLASFLALGAVTTQAAEKFTYTGPPITIRFSAYYPAVYPVFKIGVAPWMKMVEKESNGKIVFKEFLSGVLHSAKDGFKAMRSDIADITLGYPAYQATSFYLCNAPDLPFCFPNTYVASLVMEELYSQYLKKEYENMGVYLAFYLNTSTYNVITKKPIKKYEDFKGMKVRSLGGACSDMLKKIGAAPVSMLVPEIYTSFQRGIIDGALLHDNGIYTYRLHEIGKYILSFSMTRMGIPYCMNRKFFDGLPMDVKAFLYYQLRIGSQMASDAYEKSDKESRAEMIKAGVEYNTLSPEDTKKCKAALEPLWGEFVTQYEKMGLPAKQFVKDLRALSDKYETWTPEQILKHVTEHPVQGIINF